MLYKGKSKIEGNGLFSREDIKKGDYIGTFEVVEAKYVTKFSIWYKNKWHRAICVLKYANHSKKPNVEVSESLYMYALKDIKAGTEIVWDYGEGWN